MESFDQFRLRLLSLIKWFGILISANLTFLSITWYFGRHTGDDGGTFNDWQQGPSRSLIFPSFSELLLLVSPSSLILLIFLILANYKHTSNAWIPRIVWQWNVQRFICIRSFLIKSVNDLCSQFFLSTYGCKTFLFMYKHSIKIQ